MTKDLELLELEFLKLKIDTLKLKRDQTKSIPNLIFLILIFWMFAIIIYLLK